MPFPSHAHPPTLVCLSCIKSQAGPAKGQSLLYSGGVAPAPKIQILVFGCWDLGSWTKNSNFRNVYRNSTENEMAFAELFISCFRKGVFCT